MKKKVNPNRIPVSGRAMNSGEQIRDMMQQELFTAWAAFFGAVANLKSTTHDSLIRLWETVNDYSNKMNTRQQAQTVLDEIESITGVKETLTPVDLQNIRSKGELNRAFRQIRRNSFLVSLAMIAEPVLHLKIYDEETIHRLWRRTLTNGEEIHEGLLTLGDIQGYILEEYQLRLCFTVNGVRMSPQEAETRE